MKIFIFLKVLLIFKHNNILFLNWIVIALVFLWMYLKHFLWRHNYTKNIWTMKKQRSLLIKHCDDTNFKCECKLHFTQKHINPSVWPQKLWVIWVMLCHLYSIHKAKILQNKPHFLHLLHWSKTRLWNQGLTIIHGLSVVLISLNFLFCWVAV